MRTGNEILEIIRSVEHKTGIVWNYEKAEIQSNSVLMEGEHKENKHFKFVISCGYTFENKSLISVSGVHTKANEKVIHKSFQKTGVDFDYSSFATNLVIKQLITEIFNSYD